MFGSERFYLTSDGSPLKQKQAQYRIAKHGHISIKGRKNIPQNELINIFRVNKWNNLYSNSMGYLGKSKGDKKE